MNPKTDRRATASGAADLLNRFARLCRDTRAVAATEFALILPVMLLLLIGMTEITGSMNADRKVSRIASSITDLVAQAQTITKSDMDGIMDLGEKVLDPYPADELTTIIASVSFDQNGNPEVDWSYDSKKSVPWTKGAEPPMELPATVARANTSIVVGVSTLDYSPPFTGVFTDYFSRDSVITLTDTYYLRPRLTDTVDCTDC